MDVLAAVLAAEQLLHGDHVENHVGVRELGTLGLAGRAAGV